MLYQLFKYTLTLWTLFIMTFAVSYVRPVYAQQIDAVQDCESINLNEDTWSNSNGQDVLFQTVNPLAIVCTVARALNVLVGVAGVIFVGMILISAYRYATSTGDPKAIKGAQTSLTYAIAGFLIIVFLYTGLGIIGSILIINPNYMFNNGTGFGPFNQLIYAVKDLMCKTQAIQGIGC